MINEYYVARYATPVIYTFEFIVCLIILLTVLFLYLKEIDKNSLWVYIIASILHSILELLAQGSGTRVIEDAHVFTIPIGYPFTAFIIGFFEGGFIALMAYHFVRAIANKDQFSIKIFSFVSIILAIFLILGSFSMRSQIDSKSSGITLTRREIFTPFAIILLITFFLIALGYFFLNKKIASKEKFTLFYWFLGLAIVSCILVLPTHMFMIRYIEIKLNGKYIPANLFEQIAIMYGYNICLEATGFLIHYYVIIYHFKLIEFENK